MDTLSPPQPSTHPSPPPTPRRRPVVLIIAVAAAVIAAAVLFVGVQFVRDLTRPVPEFASLSEFPDASLQGTVAYFAVSSECVRIVAAAGGPSKEVFCIGAQDVSKAEKLGKELGPQLVWRADGRLEVTMFRMTDPPGPDFRAGWQKIVDVRTGAVEDVSAADVPSQANFDTHPMVSPSGQRITTSSDSKSGKIEVGLTDANGSRTLLSVQGPPNYTYGLESAFWAPNWQWIAADDGRILIITPGEPSVTRVLTDETHGEGFGGDDPRLARFAVTSENLLTT